MLKNTVFEHSFPQVTEKTKSIWLCTTKLFYKTAQVGDICPPTQDR